MGRRQEAVRFYETAIRYSVLVLGEGRRELVLKYSFGHNLVGVGRIYLYTVALASLNLNWECLHCLSSLQAPCWSGLVNQLTDPMLVNWGGGQGTKFGFSLYRLSPDHAVSHNNLGSLLSGKEAEFHFREAVRHSPQHYRAYYNLGRNLQ